MVLLLVGVSLAACGASLNDEKMAGLAPQEASSNALAGPAAGSAETASTTASGPSAKSDVAKVAEKITAVNNPGNEAYKVGPLDVLEVSVFKVQELSKTVQVSDTGSINLPLVGEMQAGGRTAREVEQDLTKSLGAKYLQNPQVTVYVKEHNSQRITVEGAVKKPGVYPLKGTSSLLQVIALAEGLDKVSDSTVVVFRNNEQGKRTAARFDMDAIRTGNADDPTVQSGDVVVAGTSAFKENLETFMRMMPVTSIFALL